MKTPVLPRASEYRLQDWLLCGKVVLLIDIHMIHDNPPECIQAEESLVEYCLDSFEVTCLVVRTFRRSEIPNQVTARNGYLISHWWRNEHGSEEHENRLKLLYSPVLNG